jgi:hypothetical protein
MIDFNKVHKPGKAVQIGVNCGLCAVALGLLLYVSLLDVTKTLAVLEASWAWVKSMALIAFIPVEAVYHFLADLPLSVQIASLTAWLWAVCVCKNLVKYGVTGPAYCNMVNTKYALLSVFLVIFSAMLIKKGVFIPIVIGFFLLWIINEMHMADIKTRKERESSHEQ